MANKKIMLDTGVVLAILKNQSKAFKKLENFKGYTFYISYFVYIEVMAGSQLKDKKDTRKFLQNFFIVKPLDAAFQKQGILLANAHFTGRENKPTDLLIAAHAKTLNSEIITKNSKHFIFKDVIAHHFEDN
jgi:predicted nucleic acid-binding protein